MGSLKDKYKATALDTLKKSVQEEDQNLNSGNNRAGYHTIEDGQNRFRLYPKHPDAEKFYIMKTVHWVGIENDEGETKRTPVLNGKVHGGAKMDIFEEYIKMSTSILKDSDDEDAEAKIKSLTSWEGGISASSTWMAYADKISKTTAGTTKEFNILEFKMTVRNDLNKIANSNLEESDEPIMIDPFTDPETGTPIVIDKSGKGNKTKYSTMLGKKAMPLTEKDLEKLDKATPLHELFSYSKSDFDKAVEGLQNFDSEHEIGVWETDEWQEKLEELKAQFADKPSKTKSAKKTVVEDDEEEEKSKKSITKKKSTPIEEEEEAEESEEEESEDEGDQFDKMDRNSLKIYNRDNNCGIIVKPSMSDDDIRIALRDASSNEETEEEEVEEEEETPPPPKKIAVKKEAIPPTTGAKAPTLADIKAKLAKKIAK